MSDTTITKYAIVALADSALYAAMLASQTAAAASATAAAASAANAAATLANAVTGSGTTNTIAKFTGTKVVGNSGIADDGTTVVMTTGTLRINNANPSIQLYKSNAPTDQKYWRFYTDNTKFYLDTVNDAFSAADRKSVV